MDTEDFRIFEAVIEKLDNFYVPWVYENMKPENGDANA